MFHSVSLQLVDGEILYKEILHQLNACLPACISSSKTTCITVLHVTVIRRIFSSGVANSQSMAHDIALSMNLSNTSEDLLHISQAFCFLSLDFFIYCCFQMLIGA